MLLELRSQGVAILLADQSSNNIPKEITDVCATKIFLGSSVSSGIEDNLQFVGSDEIALRHLYLLRPGEGVYVAPGMPAAAFFACPNVIDEFHLEQPYPKKNRYLERYPRLTLETYRECGCCPARGKCTRNDKVEARQNAALLYQQYGHMLGKLMDSKKTPEHDRQVSGMLTKIMGTLYTHTVPRRFCTMVQFVREFNREHLGLLSCQAVLKNSERLWDAMKNKT